MNRLQMFMIRRYTVPLYIPILVMGLAFLVTIDSCEKFEPASILKVKTDSITAIGFNSFSVKGDIIYLGESDITQYGFCYSESDNPNLENGISNALGKRTSTGSFQSSFSGLNPNTIYYVAAYGTDQDGTIYGKKKSFTTRQIPATVTDIDGNIYQTIKIGEQLWMKENLKVTRYADGSPIPLVENQTEWNNLTESSKAYCWYDNSTDNRDTYGGLYTWAGAMNGAVSSDTNPSEVQGVCPEGWHIPSDAEWKQLEMHLGMSQAVADTYGGRGTDESYKLKETGSAHWLGDNTGATNESGFTALPGGIRTIEGVYDFLRYYGNWWSSSETSTSNAYYRGLGYNTADVGRYDYGKDSGLSVRCVLD